MLSNLAKFLATAREFSPFREISRNKIRANLEHCDASVGCRLRKDFQVALLRSGEHSEACGDLGGHAGFIRVAPYVSRGAWQQAKELAGRGLFAVYALSGRLPMGGFPCGLGFLCQCGRGSCKCHVHDVLSVQTPKGGCQSAYPGWGADGSLPTPTHPPTTRVGQGGRTRLRVQRSARE